MTEPMLKLEAVESRRAGRDVVKGVTLDVGDEWTCVFGLNASGKSTLLRTISGLTPVTGGRIYFDGTRISGRPAHKIARCGLGFMPQHNQVFPGKTVFENLRIGGVTLRQREVQQEIDRCLELFPRLKQRIGVRAGLLSGGERQMLGMANVLMGRPRMLLLDEPSAGLAPGAIEEIYSYLDVLRNTGLAILMAEQNLERAVEACDRAFIMYLGECVATVDLKSAGRVLDARVRASMLGTRLSPNCDVST